MQFPLPNLIGHAEACATLLNLQRGGKLPHAFLLHGPKGIGKRLLVDRFALHLLAPQDEGLLAQTDTNITFDESAAAYAQIKAGANADFMLLEPEEGKKSIGVTQTKELLSKLTLSGGDKRIIIIDSADQLTRDAANMVLKTLEEPGRGIHFFLISHGLSKLLPTIISRCRQLRLSPLSQSEVSAVLAHKFPRKDERELAKLVEFSRGSVGRAIDISENYSEIHANLQAFLQTPHHPVTFVEKLARSKKIPLALTVLHEEVCAKAKLMASAPLSALARGIEQDMQLMQEYNLTPAFILEKNLRSLVQLEYSA